jgi:hypothetical protein
MARIPGQAGDVRRTIEAIVRAEVPDARCELRDYQHRIACGTMDGWGRIQDFVLVKDEWTEEVVQQQAKRLAIMVRTGGSTADSDDPRPGSQFHNEYNALVRRLWQGLKPGRPRAVRPRPIPPARQPPRRPACGAPARSADRAGSSHTAGAGRRPTSRSDCPRVSRSRPRPAT